MKNDVINFFHGLSVLPFAVQFVIAIDVANENRKATQITTYLISADSKEEALASAEGMVDSLSYTYRNSHGEVVKTECIGVHRVTQVNYLSDEGGLSLGVFQFSETTRANDLIGIANVREDLPTLNQ